MIKIQFLSENKTDNPECLAEHGLSIYIETAERKLLFDAGASGILINNAEQMDVNLEKVDAVVISHGHYDHTQGLPAFCEINDQAGIYIHENAFKKTYGFEKGKLEEETCGIRWTINQLDRIRHRLSLTRGVTRLTENIIISGSIPSMEGYSPTERFFIKDEHGGLTPDSMDHEQFLAIRDTDENGTSKGIYIFSGCSHTGIVPCLNYAKKIFPDEKIAGFIAGMHLYNADRKTREKVLEQLMAETIEVVVPVHCTGINAICDLKILMGDKCIVAGAGDTIVF